MAKKQPAKTKPATKQKPKPAKEEDLEARKRRLFGGLTKIRYPMAPDSEQE